MSAAASQILRAARPVFRTGAGARPLLRQHIPKTRHQQFRFQSTNSQAVPPAESWFKRMWNSPIGLKTVHFWAPVMKWALVLAGISDFARPAEKLSLTQNAALTMTGLIWTRWCLIIKPKNYLLAAVNFFLGCVGVVQVTRIGLWHQAQKAEAAKKEGETGVSA